MANSCLAKFITKASQKFSAPNSNSNRFSSVFVICLQNLYEFMLSWFLGQGALQKSGIKILKTKIL